MDVEYTKMPFLFNDRVYEPGAIVTVTEADGRTSKGFVQGRLYAGGEMLMAAHLDGEDVVLAPVDIATIKVC